MLSRFGIEASQAAQYVIAFVIILILVALFGLVLRRLTGGRILLPGPERGRARQPRLGIIDIYDLDRQRQLVLLRRDNVEHLLLIGGPNDVVVETNIVRVAGARIPIATTDTNLEKPEPPLERPTEISVPQRPLVEQPSRPSIESQLAARLGAIVNRANTPAETPASEEPIPEPKPRGEFPPRREPLFATRDYFAPPPSPAPVEPAASPAAPISRPENIRPSFTAPQPSALPSETPSERPKVSGAVLSDMAKQLEQALRRPGASNANPVPPAAAPAGEAVKTEETSAQDLPKVPLEEKAANNEAVVIPQPPEDKPAPLETFPLEPLETFPEEIPLSQGGPTISPAAETALPHAEASPQRTKPQSQPEPAKASDDPFSVEEIEAEFARLLGRPVSGKGGDKS